MRVRGFWDIFGAIFLLILVFLILSRGKAFQQTVTTLAREFNKSIAILQGRPTTTVAV